MDAFEQAVNAMLSLHEGRRRMMYKCTAGYNTIGVGHNLDANPISERAIDVIFADDLASVESNLTRVLPWWRQEAPARQAALIDLCFNLGVVRLLAFRNTLGAWQKKDYAGAASGLMDSLWYKQVGTRGPRIVTMVRTGQMPTDVLQ